MYWIYSWSQQILFILFYLNIFFKHSVQHKVSVKSSLSLSLSLSLFLSIVFFKFYFLISAMQTYASSAAKGKRFKYHSQAHNWFMFIDRKRKIRGDVRLTGLRTSDLSVLRHRDEDVR